MDYKSFEYNTAYQDDRNRIVGEQFPQYESYFEYVHKEYMAGKSCRQIAEPFGLSKFCIKKQLVKMGVKLRPRGGANFKSKK